MRSRVADPNQFRGAVASGTVASEAIVPMLQEIRLTILASPRRGRVASAERWRRRQSFHRNRGLAERWGPERWGRGTVGSEASVAHPRRTGVLCNRRMPVGSEPDRTRCAALKRSLRISGARSPVRDSSNAELACGSRRDPRRPPGTTASRRRAWRRWGPES